MNVHDKVRLHRQDEAGNWTEHEAQVTHVHCLAGIPTVAVIWDNPDGTREVRVGVATSNTGEHSHWVEPLK